MRFFAYCFMGIMVLSGIGLQADADVSLRILCRDGDVIDGTRVQRIAGLKSLNNVDNIALYGYSGTSGDTKALFTQDRLVVREGDIIDGHTIADAWQGAAMNDSGQVAFHARIENNRYLSGIFIDNTLVFLDGDHVDGIPFRSSKPRELSEDGTILRTIDSNIIVGNHTVLKKGDVMDGKVLTHRRQARINDSGEVSFIGSFDGGNGIFTENRLLVSVGDTIDGRPLETIPYDYEINNSGEIVFESEFNNSSGIFTQNRLIAQTGDIVDDKIISSFSSPKINDRGHVAFLATFNDGTRGIVLAVPEPCTTTQLLLGMLIMTMATLVRQH